MANGNDETLERARRQEERPDYALRESDAEEMDRALRRVTSRSAGMARQTVEREMSRQSRRSGRR